MVNGGNFIGCFYVIWNLYMFLERRRKAMYEKIREIYIEQARDREEDEISVWLKKEIREVLKSDMKDEKTTKGEFDMAFRIAEVGEEVGFIRGFRYAVQLILDCK